MEKWYYPAYLPKPPHHMNEYEWQTYKAGLTKAQMSERYSGITSDLIPAFEMIQAQGLGDNPDPDNWEKPYTREGSYTQASPYTPRKKPVSPFGTSQDIAEIFDHDNEPEEDDRFGVPEAYTRMFDEDNPPWPTNNFALQTSGFDPVKAAWQDSMSGGQQQYGLAKRPPWYGTGPFPNNGSSADESLATAMMGTEEDPSAVRLGWEWLTGTGPDERDLGEGSRTVQALKKSVGIRDARNALYQKYDGHLMDGDSYVDYPFEFTWETAREALSATEQFVGSYNVNMHVRGGRIHFEARNRTSLDSLFFGTARRKRGMDEMPTSERGPMGNKYQTFSWSEPVTQRWPFRGNTA